MKKTYEVKVLTITTATTSIEVQAKDSFEAQERALSEDVGASPLRRQEDFMRVAHVVCVDEQRTEPEPLTT